MQKQKKNMKNHLSPFSFSHEDNTYKNVKKREKSIKILSIPFKNKTVKSQQKKTKNEQKKGK